MKIPQLFSKSAGFFSLTPEHIKDPESFQRDDLENSQKIRFTTDSDGQIICPISYDKLTEGSIFYIADCKCRRVFSKSAFVSWIKNNPTCPGCKDLLIQTIDIPEPENFFERHIYVIRTIVYLTIYGPLIKARSYYGRKIFIGALASSGGVLAVALSGIFFIATILNFEGGEPNKRFLGGRIVAGGFLVGFVPVGIIAAATEAPFLLLNAIGNYL